MDTDSSTSPKPPSASRTAGGGRDERRLRAGRGRSEIVVFGRRAVMAALRDCESVEVHELRFARGLPPALRKQLVAAARERGLAAERVESAEVAALSREPRHDQGLAARVTLRRLMEVSGFTASRTGRAARRPVRLLAIDGVTNSQNVGMIVRSAVAAGMDAILWPMVGSPWINGLVVKASAATVLSCPVIRCETLVQGLAELKAAGFTVSGLCAAGEVELRRHRPAHRAVYVVGSETAGIADAIEPLLDERIHIAMAGGVESLNVAVAASLLCFEVTRARDQGPAKRVEGVIAAE